MASDGDAAPAALCFADPSQPGIQRKLRRGRWQYFDMYGSRITDAGEVARLNRLAVPPAYVDVWYCCDPHGHLQAVGTDAKGRRQYRYHADFRAAREQDKYARLAAFGAALPRLRRRVEADLALPGMGRTRVLAAIVRLLDVGHLRVGNEQYARANRSFGATTLRSRHGEVRGTKLRLAYRGKSGKRHDVVIDDRALARVVRRCQDLPGQALFQYLDDDGAPHSIGSSDVNGYIRDGVGEGFSAKHFRTWGASVIAFRALHEAHGMLTVKELVAPVAEALGNTPAISRKSYVHPALIACAGNPASGCALPPRLPRKTLQLSSYERGLIVFLETLEPGPVPACPLPRG